MKAVRRVAAVAAVVLAVLGGGLLALATYSSERELSVARIELSVQPFRDGALDIYVPLVDWGVRFDAVRAPARLSVDVRAVDRRAARRVAAGQLPDVEAVRAEARDAVASYLRVLLAVVLACALAGGVLVAFAVRPRGAEASLAARGGGRELRRAGRYARAAAPPARGDRRSRVLRERPRHPGGAPRDRAGAGLRTRDLGGAERTARGARAARGGELGGRRGGWGAAPRSRVGPPQQPAGTAGAGARGRRRAAPVRRRPDLERVAVRVQPGEADRPGRAQIRVRLREPRLGPAGPPAGARRRGGAQRARAAAGERPARPDGRAGRWPARGRLLGSIRAPPRRGLPGARRARTHRRAAALVLRLAAAARGPDRRRAHPLACARRARRRGAAGRAAAGAARNPHRPHDVADLSTSENLVELNGGTVGGGGTGNLEKGRPFGLAVLVYEARPRFEPLAADLVEIDPRAGSARAERRRLSLPAP